MGVVRFERPIAAKEEVSVLPTSNENDNEVTGEVVSLRTTSKIAKGIAPLPVYREMEAVLMKHGVNFSCPKAKSDYKILTYVLQGMMDRSAGKSSDRSMMLEVIRQTFGYEEPVNVHETNELFGDLLGQLDQ